MTHGKLVNAGVLEAELGLPRSSIYRLAKQSLIPCYRVGPKMTGVRFIVEEVLAVLRRPVVQTSGDPWSRIDSPISQTRTTDSGNHE